MDRIKKVTLCAVSAIGVIAFVAVGRTLQETGTPGQTSTASQTGERPQIQGVPGSPTATETIDGVISRLRNRPFTTNAVSIYNNLEGVSGT
jgi:hypothetical protein